MTYGMNPPVQAKKPPYKKVWFWLLIAFAAAGAILIFLITIVLLFAPDTPETSAPQSDVEPVAVETTTQPADDVPREWQAALKQAESMAHRDYSKQRVYRVLTGVHDFPAEAAEYAVDNVVADWQENANNAALDLQSRDYSHKRIERVLTTVHDFTPEEARNAVATLEP